ncbi:hypothetical protein PSTG_12169 [Puccinia striiformis f. sp. tritici PST-78]|uniref:Uncharacterized protein n=1 Tax=Puccinia striiformis f. sp. tritici PST-78 TaxID=1165861 RepID=A0A0L0V5I5_9BASI|nr:hypothetical protein PSTG_12169 [Puccinia striiformis f. sp. tritici PST-78]
MVPRKRPQLCAVDFFDLPPPESPVIKNPSNSIDADYASLTNRRDEANPGMYLSVLKGLDPDSLARELIRGKDKFDYDASIGGPYVFILQANNSMVKITDSLKVYHIATLLWGPGQREVFGGKEIHSGRLEYKVEDSGFVTTAPLYAIKFDSIRSAECASFTIEYHLNRFLDALNKEEGAPPLQVQTKIGSSRWLIEEMGSKGEPQWKAVQHRFRSLRPIIKQETTSPQNALPTSNHSAFEIANLPRGFTISQILLNLISLQLPSLPIQIKLTEENVSSIIPVRLLLRFTQPTFAASCKSKLWKIDLKTAGNESVKFVVDDGDSSVEDTWGIWGNVIVWEKEAIQSFVQSRINDEARWDS